MGTADRMEADVVVFFMSQPEFNCNLVNYEVDSFASFQCKFICKVIAMSKCILRWKKKNTKIILHNSIQVQVQNSHFPESILGRDSSPPRKQIFNLQTQWE